MKEITEEKVVKACNEVYEEMKKEYGLSDDSVQLAVTSMTLNIIKKFTLKLQED